MTGIILAIIYSAFFIFLIRKINFFHIEGINRKWLAFVFILKIIVGTALWLVYTRLYTDRLTADIFKYFDDGKIMYNTLFSKPGDYFKMLFGFPDESLNHYYRDDMRHWFREFNQNLYNENRTLIRFNAFVDIFSFGNYHVHTVFISFLSFTGLVGIYKVFYPALLHKKKEFFIIVFLIPSVLFWGSGVIKESLILFFMGMLLYNYHKLLREGIFSKHALPFLLFSFFLIITKLYMFLVLVPALLAYTWTHQTKNSFAEIKYLVVLVLCFSLGFLIPNYDFSFMLMDKQRQSINASNGGSYLGNESSEKFVYIKPEIEKRIVPLKGKPGYCKIVQGVPYVSWNLHTARDTEYVEHSTDTATYWIFYDQKGAGSSVKIPLLDGTFFSILKNIPLAFLNTAFRPHILEAKNPIMLLSAAENLFVMIFILLCVVFSSPKGVLRTKKIQNRNLICFCLTMSVLLFSLIGLTTPILGSVVRYKIPALPFFLIAFLLILDKEKLLKKLPFLRKLLT